MATYAFANGVAAVPAYGNQYSFAFSGTWVTGETWTWEISSTVGDLTVGLGQLAGLAATCCMTLKTRVYLGLGSQFNFSEIDDPTLWDEQNSGAGFVIYLNQYGSQDAIGALASLQGRLAVFARKSIQIWTVDANPANFALVQTLDNIGTKAPLSVAQIGDYDVLFLDDTGFRSLRAREVTLNAFVDDLGLPIDQIIQAVLAGYDYSGACGIVEPREKRFWCFVKDTIYVLSLFRSSKITAWSTYRPSVSNGHVPWTVTNTNNGGDFNLDVYVSPTNDLNTAKHYLVGQNTELPVLPNFVFYWIYYNLNGVQAQLPTFQGSIDPTTNLNRLIVSADGATLTFGASQTTFTPEKFVVFNGIVYCRSTDGKIFTYGGATGVTYDNTQAIAELPWLDHKTPSTQKVAQGIDVAMSGAWDISVGMDPFSAGLENVLIDGSPTTPNESQDSSFDKGKIAYNAIGTHFKFRAASSPFSSQPAVISSLVFKYKKGNIT